MKIYHWECFSTFYADKIVVAHDIDTARMKVMTHLRRQIKNLNDGSPRSPKNIIIMEERAAEALLQKPVIYSLDAVINV